MPKRSKELQVAVAPARHMPWVQVEKAALEKWAILTMENPRASALLQMMMARMSDYNSLIASQSTLAELSGCSLRTVQRSIQALKSGGWVRAVQLGPTGSVCVYQINEDICWQGDRNGKRYVHGTAHYLASESDQPEELDALPPLVRFPTLLPGERQLPTGEGLPPPSQPSIPGMEPDLPARQATPKQLDLEDLTGQALPSR